MDSVAELPMYVNCVCKDCGHKWESEVLAKNCPECNNNNIDQNVMMCGL
jgi:predicted Zn-ribbon and HTH transcriptional regulator